MSGKGGLSLAFSGGAPHGQAPAAAEAVPGELVDYPTNPRKRGDHVEVAYSYGSMAGSVGCAYEAYSALCTGLPQPLVVWHPQQWHCPCPGCVPPRR